MADDSILKRLADKFLEPQEDGFFKQLTNKILQVEEDIGLAACTLWQGWFVLPAS